MVGLLEFGCQVPGPCPSDLASPQEGGDGQRLYEVVHGSERGSSGKGYPVHGGEHAKCFQHVVCCLSSERQPVVDGDA